MKVSISTKILHDCLVKGLVKRLKSTKASFLTLSLITLTVTAISWNINWGGNHWAGIIKSDGRGYYSYLPSIFIYCDPNYGFFDYIEKEKYAYTGLFYDYRSTHFYLTEDNTYKELRINKYFAGTALAQLPFFLTAHSLTGITGCDADGYSKTYQILIHISAIFYFTLGLLFLNLLMGRFNLKEWIRSLVLIAAVFGTNLFYYVIAEPSLSHIYSLAFVAMFLYYVRVFMESGKNKYLYLIALAMGMIVLIRPVNGMVILLIPFVAVGQPDFLQKIKAAIKAIRPVLIALLIFTIIISIQFIIYKLSAGSFIIYSYAHESFDFSCPNFSDMLFSYKKGLFLYTPMYLLAFAGCWYLYRRSELSLMFWILFFLISTYVLSSWWMWYYGGSFSSRVYVEFLPAFMLLLAFAFDGAKKRWARISLVSFTIILILVCQIQTYQYRYCRIHFSEMTKEMYWEEFLRIDRLL